MQNRITVLIGPFQVGTVCNEVVGNLGNIAQKLNVVAAIPIVDLRRVFQKFKKNIRIWRMRRFARQGNLEIWLLKYDPWNMTHIYIGIRAAR